MLELLVLQDLHGSDSVENAKLEIDQTINGKILFQILSLSKTSKKL